MATTLTYSNLIFHEKLGEGGYGTVTRVTFKEPFMDQTEAAAKSVFKLEQREIEVLGKVNHPNIVGLFGLIQEGPITCIVLEYAPKGTVHDYIKEHGTKPTPDLSMQWMTESAVALEYLHRNKVIHRDLKGSNCLLFEDYKLKLSDFGLARELLESVTTSSIKGTYRYMAPEIHIECHYSCASDMWSYGMLTVEIVSGKEPFYGLEWPAVVYQITENGLNPDIPKSCPKNVAQILHQCWNRDPKQRPSAASVAVFLSGLRLHGQGSIEWNDKFPPRQAEFPDIKSTSQYGQSKTDDEWQSRQSWPEKEDVPHNPLPQPRSPPETVDVSINPSALSQATDLSWETSVWDMVAQQRELHNSSLSRSENRTQTAFNNSMTSTLPRSTGTQTPLTYRRYNNENQFDFVTTSTPIQPKDVPKATVPILGQVPVPINKSYDKRHCCLLL